MTVSGQLFCGNFVTFFRENYRQNKQQFKLLKTQFANFRKHLLELSNKPYSANSIELTNENKVCEYCKKGDKLLIKCQHKHCEHYCHITCHLQNNDNTCVHVIFFYASVSLLYYCSDHKSECEKEIRKNEMKRSKDSMQQLELSSSSPITTISASHNSSSSSSHSSKRVVAKQEKYNENVRTIYSFLFSNDFSVDKIPTGMLRSSALSWTLKQYILWEGFPEPLFPALSWTNRLSHQYICKSPFIVMDRPSSDKYKYCAVCNGSTKCELYPRYVSMVNTCCECGISVHTICSGESSPHPGVHSTEKEEQWEQSTDSELQREVTDSDGNEWKCWKCRQMEESGCSCTCTICNYDGDYLIPCELSSSSSSTTPTTPTTSKLCHISCYLATLFQSQNNEGEISANSSYGNTQESNSFTASISSSSSSSSSCCDICHNSGGVLHCSVPNCNNCFHASCVGKDKWCLFFQATTESVSFYVCCEEHFPQLRLIDTPTFNTYHPYVVRYEDAPSWVRRYNRVSHILSVDGGLLYNNSKVMKNMRELLTRCGLRYSLSQQYQQRLDRLKKMMVIEKERKERKSQRERERLEKEQRKNKSNSSTRKADRSESNNSYSNRKTKVKARSQERRYVLNIQIQLFNAFNKVDRLESINLIILLQIPFHRQIPLNL